MIVTPLLITLLTLFIHIRWTLANVEKTIFVAPPATILPADTALDNLLLDQLNPQALSRRVFINATFPTDDQPHGQATWALLEGLRPGQRYELRVCWLATQPTKFRLDTFDLSRAFETEELITSLSAYSFARHESLSEVDFAHLKAQRSDSRTETSLLLLRIQAAAAYFSTNQTLMKIVPPVHVDLILDPYLFNIFPQSLIPTAGYIVLLATGAWFLSGWVQTQLTAFINFGSKSEDTKKSS